MPIMGRLADTVLMDKSFRAKLFQFGCSEGYCYIADSGVGKERLRCLPLEAVFPAHSLTIILKVTIILKGGGGMVPPSMPLCEVVIVTGSNEIGPFAFSFHVGKPSQG